MSQQEYVSIEQFATRTSLSARTIWRLVQEQRLPSFRVGRRRVVPLKEALKALRGTDAFVDYRFGNTTSTASDPLDADGKDGSGMKTSIRVIGSDWSSKHGRSTRCGGLKAETDTDYLFFKCPRCQTDLKGGAGIRLEGASCRLDSGCPAKRHVLVFRLSCVSCGLVDHFKIAVDQTGRYEKTGGRDR